VPGFLLFRPVYRSVREPETVEAREADLVGWVYASIRIDGLLAGVGALMGDQIDFEVYQGETADPQFLLFDQDQHTLLPGTAASRRFAATRILTVFGQKWTIYISARCRRLKMAAARFCRTSSFGEACWWPPSRRRFPGA
jgi:CHASE1-domain containing sensor protein